MRRFLEVEEIKEVLVVVEVLAMSLKQDNNENYVHWLIPLLYGITSSYLSP